MNQRTVLLLDDVAADRQLAARVLRGRGWFVHAARITIEADALLGQIAASPHPLIVTDLHMPADPTHRSGGRGIVAGAQWALRVRARMERAALPRLLIVALTALTEHEIHLTALAFGCDAVVPKPITPALPEEIERTLAPPTRLIHLVRRRCCACCVTNSPLHSSHHPHMRRSASSM
jgi:CheY-like chemotaxis protein